MNEEKKDDNFHHLLIIPKLISKSQRFYKIFRPKDVIASEPCEIYFLIKNIGKKSFPGGKIQNLFIRHTTSEQTEHQCRRDIPRIKDGKSYITTPLTTRLINSGTAWFLLKVNAKDNKRIKYYQFDKATGVNNYLDLNEWTDFFYVASKQEIHQRYTNYMLLILTGLNILLFLINLILLFR